MLPAAAAANSLKDTLSHIGHAICSFVSEDLQFSSQINVYLKGLAASSCFRGSWLRLGLVSIRQLDMVTFIVHITLAVHTNALVSCCLQQGKFDTLLT